MRHFVIPRCIHTPNFKFLPQIYKRYAPDMIILKTRSEVKVTVTQNGTWHSAIPKMHPHNKFGIPNSQNIRDVLRTQKFLNLGQRSRSQLPKNDMWHPVIPRCIYTPNLNSYLKEYRRYAPDSMQFLETRSEVKFKVTVTQLWYATLCHPKMHPHTKF